MLLGAHTSIAGGVHRAIERSHQIEATALQIFSKNNSQWAAPPFAGDLLDAWHTAAESFPLEAIAIHDSYLINLCSPDETTFARSFDAFIEEHRRADQLGIRILNFHPGAACGRDRDEAIALVAEQINRVHDATRDLRTISTIETTAGQGTTLGHRFEEIAALIELVEDQDRVGVCIDTCHIFAAGYDIRTPEAYEETMREFDEIVGINRILLLHLNDAKSAFGSRVDRHEHIGKGNIGVDGFRSVMRDERLAHLPMVIETPKGKDLAEDVENLTLLRSLALID